MKYVPAPVQQEFHDLTCDEALFGGSAGPGKSLALLMDVLPQVIVEHERCKKGEVRWGQSSGWAIHVRREFPRLEQTIHRAKIYFHTIDDGFKYDETRHIGRFSSGYKFQFGHLKDRDSFLNYRSAQFTHLGIDEAGELEHKDSYDELVTRVRSTDPVLKKMLKARCASNPFPNWVRDYFIDPAPEGRKLIAKRIKLTDGTEVTRTRMFLPAKLSDNPDPEYRRQYEANLRDKPAHIRASLLNGDWYIVAGAFFADEWDPDRVVIKPFKIPSGWRRFRSGDWGYKEECVILWWAVSPEGDLICYRELTLNGRKAKKRYDAHDAAKEIKRIEMAAGEWNTLRDCSRLTGVMDTQLWEERGHKGPTMADDMARVGVYWSKATKGRKQSAQQCVRRLKERGVNGQPGLMFFETCRGCVTTIPALGTDPTDPEKPADGGPDHWWAATAYALAANAMPSGRDFKTQEDDDEEDQQPRRIYGYGSAR